MALKTFMMTVLLFLGVFLAAEETKATDQTNKLIVVFEKGIGYSDAEALIERLGMKVEHRYKAISQQRGEEMLLIRTSLGEADAISMLQRESAVKSVSSDKKNTLDAQEADEAELKSAGSPTTLLGSLLLFSLLALIAHARLRSIA